MGDMKDFYNREEAISYLNEAAELKEALLAEIKTLDLSMFIIKYYVETGEILDFTVYGLKSLLEDDDD